MRVLWSFQQGFDEVFVDLYTSVSRATEVQLVPKP